MNTGAWPALVAAAALVLTACTGPGETADPTPTPSASSATPTPTPTPSPSESPTPVAAPPPKVGDCFRLTPDELTRTTNDRPPVRCAKKHTVETVAVLRKTKKKTPSALSESCRRAVARHLGASKLELAATMARWVWFEPGTATSHWVSCELAVFSDADHLLKLPRRTKGWYDKSPRKLGICGTAAPASDKFERVICSRRHSWRVLRALPLSGKKYPGRAVVRKEGDQRCSDAVRISKGYPLRFTYGWEWPTKAQWKAGQRYGLCWTSD